MSQAQYQQMYFTRHRYPVQLDCNFIIDSTNANGTGVRSLKGPGISAVYMNTSPVSVPTTSVFASGVQVITVANIANLYVGQTVTDGTTSGNISASTTILAINTTTSQITLSQVTAGASASSPGDTLNFQFTTAAPGNPNPAAGLILVQFNDNFRRYYFGTSGFVTPLSGTSITVGSTTLTAGVAYTIVSLGTTTNASWVNFGVPVGTTPAVGVGFVATGFAHGSLGTGAVQANLVTGSGITAFEVVGDPNTTIVSTGPKILGGGSGAYMLIRTLGPSNFVTTATTATSTALTAIASTTAGWYVGMAVSGAGIALGTSVTAIVSSTAATLSQATTASATGVVITAGPAQLQLAPPNNSTVGLSFLFSNSSQGYGSAGNY